MWQGQQQQARNDRGRARLRLQLRFPRSPRIGSAGHFLLLAAVLAGCGSGAAPTDAGLEDAADALDDAGADALDAAVDATETARVWQGGRPWPSAPAATASGALLAGIAEGDLEAPIGVSMAGYGDRNKGVHSTWCEASKASRGFYATMAVKALALEVGGERLVFVKSPLLTSESFLTDSVVRALQEDHGLDLRGRLIFSATHSHHAPARFWPIPPTFGGIGLDTFDAELTARMAASFANVIAQALANAAPAEWAWQSWEGWDADDAIYRDRREENNPTWGKDPRLTLLAVRRPTGQVLASIVHFPIHGTVLDDDNDLLTEDAPGAIENKLEEAWFRTTGQPLQAMFMQCAGGDAAPAGDALGHPGPARLEKLGEDAAARIVPKLQSLSWRKTMQLAVRTVRLDFDHSTLYPGTELAHEFDQADGSPYTEGGWQCKADGVSDGQSMAGKPKLCIDLQLFLSALGVTFPLGELNQVLVSAARLDDLALLTLPGEPTYSLVDYARKAVEGQAAGIASLLVMGYSQDYFLYLTAPADWMLGGYESQMSLWGPAGGRYFADRGLALLTDVLAGKTLPVFWESSPSLSPPQAFVPRAVEASEDANTLLADLPATATRTQSVDFAWAGGDPNLGAPQVIVQRKLQGQWQAVAARTGHAGAVRDNRRSEMLTLYQPIPEVQSDVLPSRKHHWRVRWQIPADLPLGSYRLVATGQARVPAGTQLAVSVASQAMQVQAGTTAFHATRQGGQIQAYMSAQPVPYAVEPGQSWPQAGWRLVDRMQPHAAEGRVHARLQVQLLVGESPVLLEAPFDEATQLATVTIPPEFATGPLDIQVEVAGSEGWSAPIHLPAP